jgi:hypothetical protein
MMDTKTLVVGQEVYMLSDGDNLICNGKVIEVTPSGVEVRTVDHTTPSGVHLRKQFEILHFDSDGTESEYPYPSRMGVPFGYEHGPWHIDDMPFAERTAELLPSLRELFGE